MNYAHPEFLEFRPWLIAFGLLILALTLQQAWAHGRFFARESQRFGPAFSLWRALLKRALWLVAAWFLLTALATPLGEPIKIEGESFGSDIILAVDVSSSMYAQDVAPNRLTALKQALLPFVARLAGGDRVAIVAFAGEAVIACPLTSDVETASLFLDKLESDSVPRDGTGLGPALKLCLDGFARDTKRGRMIIFATDGEDNSGADVDEQSRRAAEAGVPIFTVGVGTAAGGYIPARPDMFGRVMAKTYQGKPILTRLEPGGLVKIAQITGGQYFAGASAQAMAAAYARIQSLPKGSAKVADRYSREPLYQEALFWALILFMIEALLSTRSGQMGSAAVSLGRWWRRWRAGAASAVLLLALASPAPALSLDPGRGEHDEGNTKYRQGDYAGAAEAYGRSLNSKERAATHYNLGNAQFKQGDYDGAIASYEKALSLLPSDRDAQHNLALAQRMKQKQQQGQPGQDQDKDKDKKSKGQQQGQGQQPGGQGQQGQGQGSQQKPGAQPGQGQQQDQPGKPQKGALSNDQIQAMMNMLKSDQSRFKQAFQPLPKRQEPSSQDPFDQMFEQVMGRPRKQGGQKGAETKDW